MNPVWRGIMLHHSATEDGQTVDWQAIRRYHIKERGWLDVGYNWGLEAINGQYEILAGRPLTMPGAHAGGEIASLGLNGRYLGVCVIGNFDKAPPPDEALNALAKLCKTIFFIFPHITKQDIKGHRDGGFMAGMDWRLGKFKSCPGKLFDIPAFLAKL